MKLRRYLVGIGVVVVVVGAGGFIGLSFDSNQAPRVEQRTYATKECRISRAPVTVWISARKYPQAARHIRDAVAAGHPEVLHVDRRAAKKHRRLSLEAVPTRQGFDRDEYPPAASREGGRGADVRYLRPRDNRGAGASTGLQLSAYCNGQEFRFRIAQRRSTRPGQYYRPAIARAIVIPGV